MTDTSSNLSLPYLQAAQAQKHVTHNAALEVLDMVVQLVVQSFSETTPPLAPEEGQVWGIGLGAVNDWAGQDGALAAWAQGGWLFIAPAPGWRAAMGTEVRVFDGADWVAPDLPALQNLPGVGVNASHDATNKLAVASEAALFTHIGNDVRLTVNKAAAADTAALLFQTNWSGRAEMGTLGDNNFAVKVSADGSSWTTALAFAAATGLATGAAVQSGAGDNTAGRLLRVGAFGLGLSQASVLAANLDATDIPTGLYRTDSGSTGTFPAGEANFGVLLQHNYSANEMVQRWSSVTGRKAYHRYYRASLGGWQPWQMEYTRANILGAVSQSGGVPTGALIEYGSNANGAYVRFADGTQWCWSGFGSSSTGADDTWTYPAVFAAAPRVSVSPGATSGTARFGTWVTAGTTSLTYAIYGVDGARKNAYHQVIAFGRWF